jgi:hypothetical protein
MLGWNPSNVSGVRWTGATLNRETSGVGCSTKKSGVGSGGELGCKGLLPTPLSSTGNLNLTQWLARTLGAGGSLNDVVSDLLWWI